VVTAYRKTSRNKLKKFLNITDIQPRFLKHDW
jgi:hypothetical protein